MFTARYHAHGERQIRPPSDLDKVVKEGDTVTLKYLKSTDLYGKEIIKK